MVPHQDSTQSDYSPLIRHARGLLSEAMQILEAAERVDPSRPVEIRLTAPEIAMLRTWSQDTGLSVSDLVRRAVDRYLLEIVADGPPPVAPARPSDDPA